MRNVHSHYPENGLNKQYEQRTDSACVWVVLLSVLLLLKWLLQIWILCALHIPALLEIWCEDHTINSCEAVATPMLSVNVTPCYLVRLSQCLQHMARIYSSKIG